VFAVQSVAIEKHEMRRQSSVDGLVNSEQALDRSTRAAFRLRVQCADLHSPDWRLTLLSLRSALRRAFWLLPGAISRTPLGSLRSATVSTLATRLIARHRCYRVRPTTVGRPTRAAPWLLDFRHSTTDNQLQM